MQAEEYSAERILRTTVKQRHNIFVTVFRVRRVYPQEPSLTRWLIVPNNLLYAGAFLDWC